MSVDFDVLKVEANSLNKFIQPRTFTVEVRFNKKAELPQRWPRDAPCIWVPWKISTVP